MKRSQRSRNFRLTALFIIICAASLFFVESLRLLPVAAARVGGGHSYSSRGSSSSSRSSSGGRSSSGSSSSGGSSSGGGDFIAPLFYFLFTRPFISLPLLAIIAFLYFRSKRNEAEPFSTRFEEDETALHLNRSVTNDAVPVAARFAELRKYDPNFSEALFNDFLYTLYARVQEARPSAALDQFASYLDKDVIGRLRSLNEPGLQDIKAVIVGAASIKSISDLSEPTVLIEVEFEANYTEVYTAETGAAREETWYTREVWRFSRRRDALSRPPEQITALHCPKCGGGLEKKADGSCAYCGAVVADGSFDWFVTDLRVLDRVAQGPLLTQDVEEEGTDWPTRYQPDFASARRDFMAEYPGFSWPQLETRMRYIFMELQQAWTTMEWERARPFETDNVFQTHLYWITEYRRQRLRNVLDQIVIERIVPVKIIADAFYDAITVRIYASMIDYTTDASGKVLSGKERSPRSFTEYWTFIRRRAARPSDKQNDQCPNCAAPLKINMAGICEYCGGKISSGDFDWVLSRIEQDESYQG